MAFIKKPYSLTFLLLFVVGLTFSQKEDLSVYRNRYPQSKYLVEQEEVIETPVEEEKIVVDPSYHLNAKLDSTFKKIKVFFDGITYTQGYRVQLYSGNDMKSSASIESRAKSLVRGYKVYRDYNSPTWKVRVGDFIDRLSAEQLYQKLKKNFPNALIVPDSRVLLKKVK